MMIRGRRLRLVRPLHGGVLLRGWPFRTGLVAELRRLQPGMMTLIALAISVAYFYSSAAEQGIKASEVRDFENLPGRGAQALVEGRRIAVVSPGYLRERSTQPPSEGPHALMAEGKTVAFVLEADQPIGAIALADVVRPESREAIARLKAMGVQCMMLTGNSSAVAKRVAADLGLDDHFAQVLPHQKAEKIREVKERGLAVAMVGDGVNDAPALVEADLGIAIGAGTDVAIQSADIVLVQSDPRNVADVMAISRATSSKMIQNLLWATGYNTFAIPLAAGAAYTVGVLLTPAFGAAIMSLSTVIVAINANLLQRTGRRRAQGGDEGDSAAAIEVPHLNYRATQQTVSMRGNLERADSAGGHRS